MDAEPEDLTAAKLTASAARQALHEAPDDVTVQSHLVWALHSLAGRFYQAGRQAESAGLGTEAVTVITTTAATGDVLISMAENLLHIGGYLVPGTEAITAAQTGVEVLRRIRAAAPGPGIDDKLVWSLHSLAGRFYQAGRQPESAGLGAEASAVVTATTATSDVLVNMAENLLHIGGYLAPGAEAVTTAQSGVEVLRRTRAATAGPGIDNKLVWSLHSLAGRFYQAGRQPESAGLGAEAVAIITTTAATGDVLINMAENLLHIGGYLPAGAEAITAAQTGAEVLRRARTATPGPGIDNKLVWSLHSLAGRFYQAGRQPESAGLGTEAVTVITTTAATGDVLINMAENLLHIGGYLPAGAEGVTTAQSGVEVLRRTRAASPGPGIDDKLVWSLHSLAGRMYQAGRQPESAGLGTEAVTVITTTAATGDVLINMAENLLHIGGYLVPGAEAVSAAQTGVEVLRRARAATPGPGIDNKLVWSLHTLAGRFFQAGRQPESAGLGAEASAVVTATTATSDMLVNMAENLLHIGGYLPASLEQVDVGTVGWKKFGELFRADPANGAVAQKYGWAETRLIEWRVGIGLPPVILVNPEPDPEPRRHFDDGTPVSAISRNPNQMDVFAIGRDGSAHSMWWNGLWRERFRVGSATFPAGSPIGALSRSPDYMDLFTVGHNGGVWNAWWHGEWHDWYQLGDITLPDRTPIATLSRSPDYQDVFAVGPDGHVWGNWWHGQWHDWYQLGDITLPDRTPIATLSRSPDYQDVFAVGPDGRVLSNWWHGQWHDWFPMGDVRFPHRATLSAVSRNSDQMDIFGVREDGTVWTRSWHGGWAPWSRVGDMTFNVNVPIVAISRNPDQMDLFAVAQDGSVWSASWDGNWHPWYRVGDGRLPPRAQLAVVSRNPNQLDVFGVGDGGIQSTWWHGEWKSWFRIPWSLFSFGRPVESAGLAALGGWATVSVLDDCSIRFYGHFKNSGIDSYGVSLPMAIRPSGGVGGAVVLHHYADVGSHDYHDWDEWQPPHAHVLANQQSFMAGSLESNLQYSSGLADAVRDSIAWSTTVVIGWTPAGLAIGPILMVGGALWSWIDTGSVLPGLMATGSTLWMAGPTGMLVAYPVQQWVGDAATSRPMHDNEITWAQKIFGDKLPVDRIRITKLIGLGRKPFAALVHNGTITINMGEEAYDDPFGYHTGPGSDPLRRWGETFAHELTHAWQLEHYSNSDEIARVLAAQLQNITGDPYQYGVGAPWHAYNPEAQANLVSHWYARHINQGLPEQDFGLSTEAAVSDGNFRYVRDNIRKGAT